MQLSSLLAAGVLALAVPLACSGSTGGATGRGGSSGGAGGGLGGLGGTAGQAGDDLLFVPEGLPNKLFDEQRGTIALVAVTLVQGATGPELYAAVRNDGQMPACEAGMMISFYDKADQHLTDTGAVLLSGRFYRLDSGVVLSCIDPGQIAMAAATDIPDSIVIGELGYLEHRFPLFTIDGIQRVDGLAVSGVEATTTGAGSAYTGTLTNGFSVTVSNPSVAIFPVNRVGRPLGMARADATTDLPPGGGWSFQTSTVGELGAGYVAYPGAVVPNL
jgi:hypothetical protein